jgi:hypothetical protein
MFSLYSFYVSVVWVISAIQASLELFFCVNCISLTADPKKETKTDIVFLSFHRGLLQQFENKTLSAKVDLANVDVSAELFMH